MTTVLSFIEVSCDGGAQRILLSLLAGLDRSRFRPIVALLSEGWLADELRRRGEQVEILPTVSGGWDRALLRGLSDLCRRERVDLIHAHLFDSGVYASLVGMVRGIPVVVSLHGQADWVPIKLRAADIVKRLVINRASRITYVSEVLRRHFESLGLASRLGHVIHNGIPIGEVPAPAPKSPSRVRIGAVGHVKPWKAYEDLIAAAALVVAEEPSAQFEVVGLTDLDPDYTAMLETRIDDAGLRNHFRFLGARAQVTEFLSGLDVYVLPSHSEGFSLSLVEAMAAGRPAVATRCGGPEEILTDGVTGVLVPPKDPRTMATRLLELLRSPERSAELGARASADVRRRFSQTAMVTAYHAVYASVVRQPRRPSIYEAKKEGV